MLLLDAAAQDCEEYSVDCELQARARRDNLTLLLRDIDSSESMTALTAAGGACTAAGAECSTVLDRKQKEVEESWQLKVEQSESLLLLSQNSNGCTKPRNPRHFDGIEGGRKCVSDVFTHKNSGSCI